MRLQDYWQGVQDRVCVKCIDGDGKGNCRLDTSLECPLKSQFSFVVEAVKNTTSAFVQDYTDELRKIVCGRCAYVSPNGYCAARSALDCALDRYFPMVIEEIERLDSASDRKIDVRSFVPLRKGGG